MRVSIDRPMNRPAPLDSAFAHAALAQRRRRPLPFLSRHVVIALAVVLLHIGLIWALQSGLLKRSTELLVPVELLSQLIEPAVRPLEPAVPMPPAPVPPAAARDIQKKAVVTTPARKKPQPQQPQPLAIADSTPSPNAPAAVITPSAPPVPTTTSVQTPPTEAVAAPATATAQVQLPSSDAQYLQNPKPPYPALSMRLGETGQVVYKVWIGVDGKAERAELVKSSGFARLDSAAYDTVMRWRYVPGKRNGVAEAMPFNVPINWELRN
jgi:periplasmic protein TonB